MEDIDNEDLRLELERTVEAFEQVFAILVGVVAEQTDVAATFKQLAAAETSALVNFGPNEWRDRLLRKATVLCALKARKVAHGDPALRALVTRVLTPRDGDEPLSH